MSREDLEDFVHLRARTLSESKRDEFIERMMQRGYDDLEDIDEFLADWIKYLGAKKGNIAQRLIKEASELLNDGESRLGIAEKYCAEHPGLYEQILI